MAAQSLFQRTHTDEFRFRVMSACVDDCAVESLHNKGFLERHALERNAWMIEQQRSVIQAFYDRVANKHGKARGRPANGYVRNLILSAAVETELANGLGPTAAYRAAAKRLGEPMTKDKAQNAYLKFQQTGIKAFSFYLLPHEAEHRRDSLVVAVRSELDRLEQELAVERETAEVERRSRRFARQIGGCFGADDAATFSNRTRGAK